MALSVFSFEECNPPSDFIQLAYNVSSPNSLDTSTVFNTYSTNGTSLSLGSSLTQPTECGSGMDIVFMVDYTGSMNNPTSPAISNVKTGITNILSTIATESLDNFRVGLCIFDEYAGSVTSPSLYGTNTNYTSLPASQKVTINGVGHTQFITCMHPMGGVGDTSVFQTQLNKLAAALPLGDGDGTPEPGGLGVYEVIQNGIAGGFREDAIKVIILITDDIPGGNDDLANATDTAYFANTLIPLADSLNIQTLVQSTKAYNTTYNNYYALATGTTPIGRYDQVSFATSGWINTGLIAGIQSLCGSSYTATCDCAPSGWYHEDGSSYAFYFDATTCEITNQYNFPPTYTVAPDRDNVNEDGSAVIWTIETTHVPDGTRLYWDILAMTAHGADTTQNVDTGSVIVYGNTATVTRNIAIDNISEGPEFLQLRVRTISESGTVVATADPVVINDTSTPTATPNPPTPTPTVYQLYSEVPFGNGGKSTDPCGDTTYGIWTQDTSVTIGLQIGDSLYSNASLTPFIGNNLWYGIGDYFGGVATRKVQISDTGIISNITSCYIAPTATPIPPTPTTYDSTNLKFLFDRCVTTSVSDPEQIIISQTDWIARAGTAQPSIFDNITVTQYSLSVYTYNSVTSSAVNATINTTGASCTTPTATPVPEGCLEYSIFANAGVVFSVSYIDCDGNPDSVIIDSGDEYPICSTVYPTVIYGSGTITATGLDNCFITLATAIPTPTPLPATATPIPPTPTPSGSGGIGCLITGTQITLADNTLINIEDLLVGTELLSTVFGDMPDTDDVSTLKAWTSASPVISNTTTYLTSITSYIVDKVYNFNNGLIISSYNHLHIVKKNNIWTAAEAYELNIGDVLMSVSGEIVISSIAIINESTTVYKLDVETNDTFIANGIITHNVKIECDPCDQLGECYDPGAFCVQEPE